MSELRKWFFNFAYRDLDEVSDEDLSRKILQQYMRIITGDPYGAWTVSNPRESLRNTQSAFMSVFLPIMGKVKEVQESKETKPKWDSLKQGFGRIETDPWADLSRAYLSPHSFMVRLELRPFVSIPLEHKGDKARRKGTWFEDSTIQLISDPLERANDIFLIRFLEALNGLKLSALLQCGECQKWFIHTSKHDRQYCSNRCGARKKMREIRAEIKAKDGEKYKEYRNKGKERAVKSYANRLPPGAKRKRRNHEPASA